MSTRSDVGIAIKKDGIDELQLNHSEAMESIRELADEIIGDEEGTLYVLRDVKWNETITQVADILSALGNLPDDWYYLVECYHDAEVVDSDSSLGTWIDNPWNLSLAVRVELQYEN